MFTRMREAGLLLPAVATLAAFGLLVWLGNWQMERKAWKEELLSGIETGAKGDPVGLADVLTSSDLTSQRFRRVSVSGRFSHEHEFHVWHPGNRGPAWEVITPVILDEPVAISDGAPMIRAVLVIRGSVLEALKDPTSRQAGQIAGPLSVTGRVRLGGTGTFSSTPDPEKNQWYEKDAEVFGAHLDGGLKDGAQVIAAGEIAPVFIEAETLSGGVGAPEPQLAALELTNRHLEYALTWYGLAATLIAVFLAFAISRLRRGAAAEA